MAELRARLDAALGDRYRVEHELGRGGMGAVFLAHDTKHDRRVALKVLRPEVANTVGADRFVREIRIAARLQHPNIVPLIDSGEADGLAYYVMPYVPGESLRDRLAREQQLPLDETIRIAREMADALAHAHAHGFIHRDIKPENILLAGGHALLADFGVAHILLTVGEKLTETGIAVGTPAYMSPEQGAGAGPLDHRSDIYSLGCVVYEMLAGSAPFTGTYQAVLARKAVEPVPSIRVVRDTVPIHVEQAVMQAMAKVPADRFASATAFADALAGEGRAHTVPMIGSSRRRWMLAGAAGAVLMIAGTYVLVAGRPFGTTGPDMAEAHHKRLTFDQGVEWFPSFSADGRWIVYAGERDGNRDIFLQSITGQVPINLTGSSPTDDDQPAFSPDGERIAFRSERDGGGIFVMGRTGEAVRRITTAGFHPTWSPDGRRIAYVSENVELNPGNSEAISELWIVSASGGESRKLPTGDAILPSWSPNGHRIAYGGRIGSPPKGDIWTIDPDDGEPVLLTGAGARDWNPSWSPDGRYIYFASDRGGSMNLWRIPVDERRGTRQGQAQPLTTPATFLGHPTVHTGDSVKVAYTSADVTINIQRIAFDPHAGVVAGAAGPVTSGNLQFSSPDPSPDGEWVAYYTLTQPEGHIYVSRFDGTQRRQLTADTAADRLPRWSPDGQWLAFFSDRSGQLEVWKIRVDGSGLQRLTSRPTAYLAWSPDGRRIATNYILAADTVVLLDAITGDEGNMELLPPSPRGPFLVNSWSPDGQHLAGQIGAVGGMGRGIATYSFRTRTYEKLTDFGEWPVWLPDGRRILFVAHRTAFYVVDARTKQVRRVWSMERDVIGPPRLTRDGRWAYFSRRVTESDVWMLTLPVDP